jgi:hypothetical protein
MIKHGVSRAAGRMSEHFSIASAQIQATSQRVADLASWLAQNASYCEIEQKHLNEGAVEQAYWHYGYLSALRDVVSMLSRRSAE